MCGGPDLWSPPFGSLSTFTPVPEIMESVISQFPPPSVVFSRFSAPPFLKLALSSPAYANFLCSVVSPSPKDS